MLKIFNPKSGRWVSSSGRVALALLKSHGKTARDVIQIPGRPGFGHVPSVPALTQAGKGRDENQKHGERGDVVVVRLKNRAPTPRPRHESRPRPRPRPTPSPSSSIGRKRKRTQTTYTGKKPAIVTSPRFYYRIQDSRKRKKRHVRFAKGVKALDGFQSCAEELACGIARRIEMGDLKEAILVASQFTRELRADAADVIENAASYALENDIDVPLIPRGGTKIDVGPKTARRFIAMSRMILRTSSKEALKMEKKYREFVRRRRKERRRRRELETE